MQPEYCLRSSVDRLPSSLTAGAGGETEAGNPSFSSLCILRKNSARLSAALQASCIPLHPRDSIAETFRGRIRLS